MNNSIIPKAAVVIPFIGKWPAYFPLFLKGCAQNTWLDVLFFTNCPKPQAPPPNLKFFSATLSSISRLASEKLELPLTFTHSYKLCDLKPFYGKVFEDYLKEYDYWGYGDVDLLYGDAKAFLVPLMQEGLDVISNRREILSGSLALLRNNEDMKMLATHIPEWKERLQSPKHENLDETANSNIIWEGGLKTDLPPQCFTKLISDKLETGSLKAHFKYTCREHLEPGERIYYKNGQFMAPDGPMAYVHFVNLKRSFSFRFPRWKQLPDEFFITDTGFYKPGNKLAYTVVSTGRKLCGKGRLMAGEIYRKIKAVKVRKLQSETRPEFLEMH